MKKNEGITLVALIITIIVMLILVGVSISVLINSDLIGTAQNAGERTESAYEEEGNLGAIKVGDKSYAGIQDYLDGNIMPEWELVYEGEDPTTDGQLMISNEEVFSGVYKYRITLDASIVEEPIECIAIKGPTFEGGMTVYMLFAIANGEIKKFTSFEDVNSFQNELNSNPDEYQSVIWMGGANISGAGSIIMAQTPDESEITITKIERKALSSHNWKYTDNTMAKIKCTCIECREVNKEGVTLTIGQDAANYTAGPEGTEWIVFGTEDQDANGIYESILITTKTVSTADTLELSGDAYINGIAQIEAKVDEIYSTEARSMTIEDVNRTLGYIPTGGMYIFDGSTCQYYNGFDTTFEEHVLHNVTKEYKEDNSIEGDLTADQQAQVEAEVARRLSGLAGPEEGKDIGSYKINGYVYAVNSTAVSALGYSGMETVPTTTSNTAKLTVFGTANDMQYWLASRGIYAYQYFIFFLHGAVKEGTAGSARFEGILPVRPVVSLGTNVHSVIGE